MNRKIKFRAWYPPMSKQGVGTMSNEVYLDFNEDESDHLNFKIIDVQFSKTILMQYIGLQDKNGKEIYEGDIVSYGTYKHEVKIKEHEDSDGALVLGYGFASPDTSSLKVIGNIYENPELLT